MNLKSQYPGRYVFDILYICKHVNIKNALTLFMVEASIVNGFMLLI